MPHFQIFCGLMPPMLLRRFVFCVRTEPAVESLPAPRTLVAAREYRPLADVDASVTRDGESAAAGGRSSADIVSTLGHAETLAPSLAPAAAMLVVTLPRPMTGTSCPANQRCSLML